MAQHQATGDGQIRRLNHMAISVPDLDAAVHFYRDILGFRQMRANWEIRLKEKPLDVVSKIYGDTVSECDVAFLSDGHGIGFELFQFKDPPYSGHPNANGFQFARGGVFHIAITHPDPDALCEKMVAAGGKQIGETVALPDGNKGLYCHDPWGTVIEVLSCDFSLLLAEMPVS